MAPPGAELLITAIAAAAVLLAPFASWLIGKVGEEISRELDGGRTGPELTRYLTGRYTALAERDNGVAHSS
jgi:hypothetical protein